MITLEIGGAMLDSVAFAKKIEKAIFPHDLHFKVALTGDTGLWQGNRIINRKYRCYTS